MQLAIPRQQTYISTMEETSMPATEFENWIPERADSFRRLAEATLNYQVRSEVLHFELVPIGRECGEFKLSRDGISHPPVPMHYFGNDVVLDSGLNGDQSFNLLDVYRIVAAAYAIAMSRMA